MSLSFTTEELVPVSEFQKHMAKYRKKLKDKKLKRIGLMKNNKVDMLVMNIEEVEELYRESYQREGLTENGFTPEYEEYLLKIEKEEDTVGPFTPDEFLNHLDSLMNKE